MAIQSPLDPWLRSAGAEPGISRRSVPTERAVSSTDGNGRDESSIRWVKLIVLVLVLGQRFVLPGTSISIAVPVVFAVLGVLLVRRAAVFATLRTGLYLTAIAACVLATTIATLVTGLPFSLNSLLLLVVLYAPCCCTLVPRLRQRFWALLEFFQRLMIAAAAACLVQFGAQLAGWESHDLLGFLPERLLASGYNLTYPIYYGSPLVKSNGIVFLEPSFASQFIALALVVQLLLGGGRWRLVLFGIALLSTFSGTGLVLLAVGLAVIAVRRGLLRAVGMLLVTGVLAAALATTIVGSLLVERASEFSQSNSSASARFITPYENVAGAVTSDTAVLLVGRGPGAVGQGGDTEFFNPQDLKVNYPSIPKLLGEYGIFATIVFLGFVLVVFGRKAPSITLGILVCILYLTLSGSFLQAQTIYTSWVLTGLFSLGAADSRSAAWHTEGAA